MTRFTPERLLQLAPKARATYQQAFTCQDVLLASGLLATPLRLAHFLAQVCHETAGLTLIVENMHYQATRIRAVWPSRFPTVADAEPFAGNPRALANKVYGGRMGNVGPEDGFRYIGRGLLQLTGRESYQRIGDVLKIDLVGQPYLATSPEHALAVATAEWHASGCMPLADANDIIGVTRAINGGTIGLPSRREWLVKAKALLDVEDGPETTMLVGCPHCLGGAGSCHVCLGARRVDLREAERAVGFTWATKGCRCDACGRAKGRPA